MAKKEDKMISVAKMDEIMDERFPNFVSVDYYGEELRIRRVIEFDTFTEIVQSVVRACFRENDGAYMPENKDYAIRLCVIDAYSNVRLPDNKDKRYKMTYCSDLFDTIVSEISVSQYEAMIDAIEEGIMARNDMNRQLFEHGTQIVTDEIAELGKQLGELFGGVSPEDLQKLVSAVGEGGVDEEKLVQAVVAEQNKLRESAEEKKENGE